MINSNLKSLLSMCLQSAASVYGCMPINAVDGRTYYQPGQFIFPWTQKAVTTLSATTAGISVGKGTTPATEDDLNLEDTITAGINLTLAETVLGCDSPGNPWIQYKLTVTNTGSEAITITEVGYKQILRGVRWPGGTSITDVVCLIDRTVLSVPVTIEAGDAGVILYKLKTNSMPVKVVGGVEIVSWTWGTDEQIAAMITAAHTGTIDLQRDARWKVGDVRLIQISAFSSTNVNHAAQTVALVISSFEEYEGCGNVLQFDFYDPLAAANRMNATNTNAGGYGESEMKTVTLPALETALPSWLRELLKTFSVKVSAGSQSDTIETVTDNKLALRSEAEIFGTTTLSKPGEGAQVELYKRVSQRNKPGSWWGRSPVGNIYTSFCLTSSGNPGLNGAANTALVAPFGCI